MELVRIRSNEAENDGEKADIAKMFDKSIAVFFDRVPCSHRATQKIQATGHLESVQYDLVWEKGTYVSI